MRKLPVVLICRRQHALRRTPDTPHIDAVPRPQEGRTRRHERWVRDAVDATATQDERSYCGRRSRVVLTPRRWRQVSRKQFREATVARKPGHRGEYAISR
jgi:hypothetical protein